MKQYIFILLLFFISIAQVAWGSFMVAFGVVVPILPIYIWWLYAYQKPAAVVWYAFIGGLVVDLLSTSSLGLHALILLLGLGLVMLFNHRVAKGGWVTNIITLSIMLAVYITIPFYLS